MWICNTIRVLTVKKDICRNIWYIHCKNSFGINSIIYLYRENYHSVRNKGDLDRGKIQF